MEQQMAYCGREVMEKTVLVAMKKLKVTKSSYLSDVFATLVYNSTQF
jgi:hypothetical protein